MVALRLLGWVKKLSISYYRISEEIRYTGDKNVVLEKDVTS